MRLLQEHRHCGRQRTIACPEPPNAILRPILKRPFQIPIASDLTARERVLLLCIASGMEWQKAGVPGETVIDMIEKGLIVDHPFDRLALTIRGRAMLKTMLSSNDNIENGE